MNPHKIRICLSLHMVVAVAACSATTVRESWTNPEFERIETGKLMVIAAADDGPRRSQFESDLAAALTQRGVNAVARSRVNGLRGKPGRETIVAVVREQKFDHVLVTRLSAIVEEEIEHAGTTEYELYGFRGRFGRYWITDVDVIERPGYTEKRTRLFLETSMFETGEGKVVWRMRTETDNPQETRLSSELVDAITGRLESDGIVGS